MSLLIVQAYSGYTVLAHILLVRRRLS